MPTASNPKLVARGPSRTLVWLAVVWFALAAIVVAINPNFRQHSGLDASPFGGDFLQEWIGGHIVRQGDWSRFYDPGYARELEHNPQLVGFQWAADRYLPMCYPPFYYVLVSPLSLLPIGASAWLWAMLMIACWPLSCWLIHRGWNVAVREPSPSSLNGAVLLAIFFAPLIESLVSCQKGTLVLLLFAGTWYALRRGWPLRAGMVAGLLLFKPQFAIVLVAVMAVRWQWRFVIGFCGTALVLVGVCFAMGTDVCQQYFAFAQQAGEYIRTSGYAIEKSHCWYGFFTLLAGGRPDGWPRVATVVAIAVTLGLVGWAWRGKIRVDRPRFSRQFAIAVLATLLVSPHLFTYDLTLLALPMVLISMAQSGRSARQKRMALGMVVAVFVAANVSVPLAQACRIQLSTLVMFAAVVVLSRPRVFIRSAARMFALRRIIEREVVPRPRLLRG